MKLGDEGKPWHDDPKINSNWYSYGMEVLAAADGVVASIKDGIAENTPISPTRAVPITGDTIGGNTVVLALGNGAFAYYAHLQPGSVRVKPGDRVRRGQVLGLLGNSGNSNAPHLHFHISNDNSLAGEGLPYVFDSFEVLGTADYDKVFENGWRPPAGAKVQKLVHEMPAENAAVRFATR
jgi:murein DD-endopeptidase MepM/ murein hydrolase activator NlpD